MKPSTLVHINAEIAQRNVDAHERWAILRGAGTTCADPLSVRDRNSYDRGRADKLLKTRFFLQVRALRRAEKTVAVHNAAILEFPDRAARRS